MVRSFDFDFDTAAISHQLDPSVPTANNVDEIIGPDGQAENPFMWRAVSVNAIRFLPNAEGFAMATSRGHVIFARPKESFVSQDMCVYACSRLGAEQTDRQSREQSAYNTVRRFFSQVLRGGT